MEQNNYIELEIINELLKGNLHARELSRKLNINHMTISRKINQLIKENVVDYKQEGRNKVYFIKNTIEASTKILITENHKKIKILNKHPKLRKILDKINEDKSISLAILFGSYAKGTENKDSDVDIYVETTSRKIKERLDKYDSKISVKIGKFEKNSPLIKEIKKNHVIIKGIEKYYELNKFPEET